MNHLVIYAHPNPASFNHAILEAYTRELAAAGHEVRIRDLYATGFNPVILQSDYDMINRGTPEDIRQEQDHIRWAGVMTFIFPVFWAGMPAMLKVISRRSSPSGSPMSSRETDPGASSRAGRW